MQRRDWTYSKIGDLEEWDNGLFTNSHIENSLFYNIACYKGDTKEIQSALTLSAAKRKATIWRKELEL